MDTYYNKIQIVKSEIVKYLNEIFKVYGNELLLRLEDYNLLSAKNNCIETSTATGFVMEEFIVSKLEIYTKNHNGKSDIKIQRKSNQSTGKSSYDCYAKFDGIFVMINVKIEKANAANNAVAAINILHNDYVLENPEQEKAYLVLKTYYDFGISQQGKERKILIKNIDAYCIEELDFSQGHKQDYRNWSTKFKANSGRLLISAAWKNKHLLNKKDVSCEKTKRFINEMYTNQK